MKDKTSHFIVFAVGACLLVFARAGIGSCKKWQYDECVNVGHGPTYCAAVVAGCFDSHK